MPQEAGRLPAVFFGYCTLDVSLRVHAVPSRGETILAHAAELSPGGVAANQAVQFARLGGDARLVSAVGDDQFGGSLLDGLDRAGVSTAWISRAEGMLTTLGLILVEEDGSNRIVVAPGASLALDRPSLPAIQAALREARAAVVELQVSVDAVEVVSRLAQQARVPVILCLSPARPMPTEIMRRTDIIILNDIEARALLGLRTPQASHEEFESLHDMSGWESCSIIVTLGAEGALLLTRDGRLHVPGHSVQTVDTTGAGDSFVGALVYTWTSGASLPDSIAFANAAAAVSTTKSGAQNVPDMDQVAKFLGSLEQGSSVNA